MLMIKKTILASWVLLSVFSCEFKSTRDTHASTQASIAHTSIEATAYAATSADGKGAVATVNPIATSVALDMFAKGGNAIDAALSAAFTLGVVDSHNSGIGGGCFILARLSDGQIIAIDGREMAPRGARKDMYIRNGKVNSQLSKTGALAIGVPGSVAALHRLQQMAGKRSFSETLLPAAHIAERGFPVDHVFAKRLARTQNSLRRFPASARIFLPEGRVLDAGEHLVQKDLAATYRLLAKKGPDYFYKGEFAQKVSQWMAANDGIIDARDFADYELVMREPIKSRFQSYEVYGFPPPSSGGVHVAQILTMMEQGVRPDWTDVDRYHFYAEASKRAFADRAHWLGDSDFVSVPRGLVNPAYLKGRMRDFSPEQASLVQGHGIPPRAEDDIFGKHTTHLVTSDAEGNWVSITTTLNTSYGSKVTIPGTGVLMNNQMDDFSAKPGVPNAFGVAGAAANAIAPKKRPLSSMSPTIITKNGQPVLAVGAAGGPTIISQVAQTIIHYVMLDLPLADAMKKPRIHHQWKPNRMFIDGYAEESIKVALEKKGHAVKTWPAFGATQAIGLKDGRFDPQSEPRIQ